MYQVVVFLLIALSSRAAPADENPTEHNKLTYHNDAQRTGWNFRETVLNPKSVSRKTLQRIWRSAPFDAFEGVPPRLFATPLYVNRVKISAGMFAGQTFSVIYSVTTTGYVYAVNAFPAGETPAGSILWSARLTTKPCSGGTFGNLSTPIIDPRVHRLYVTSCDDDLQWRVHALDIRTGREARQWPVRFDPKRISTLNRNGRTAFGDKLHHLQRGALNLSPDGARLYVTFAGRGEFANGWLVSLDTRSAQLASAFSATAATEERQGGMWSSGGPAIDRRGDIYVTTGSNAAVVAKKLGLEAVFPESPHNWGQSVLKLRDAPGAGLELMGTYTPFNYCQAAVADTDLGSSSATLIDLDPGITRTPHLLALGGKQGNVYLVDRAHMPGGILKRQPCSNDSASDGSLLAPEPQPQFQRRGPLHVFGPYTDDRNMEDQAKSRATAAYFRSKDGRHFIFVTGSAKAGTDLTLSVPPGLARLEIVASPSAHAYLRIDRLELTQVFYNPGSPVVTSHGGRDAIVWIFDANAPRTAPLYGSATPQPILYAFDALTLELLWKSAPGQLATSGKYNEPTIVRGTVFVGTDRVEAFALKGSSAAEQDAEMAPSAPSTLPQAAVVATDQSQSVPAPDTAEGARLYQERCAMCHESGQPGIPTREQLARLSFEKIVFTLRHGAMQNQAFGLSAEQIRSLTQHLIAKPAPVGDVTMSRLLNSASEPGVWLTGGRDYQQSYYSPLSRINRENVRDLGVAWLHSVHSIARFEATPIVVDGAMFTSGPLGAVYALDARTGAMRWMFKPEVDHSIMRRICCGPVNRGVAVWQGKVYVASLDGHLYALRAETGEISWRVDTIVDRSRGYSITGAPYIAGKVVVIGNAGGDFDARGYITAYDTETGRQAWRFFTVPGEPTKAFEHPELQIAARTWDPNSSWPVGGGGTVWDGMAYDPKLNLLYVGTGNANPWPRHLRSPSGGDNLFLSSILAIRPDTGRLVWYYQTTPGDNWDYTATQKLVLADLQFGGRLRKIIMQAPKNGFFYVLDRSTGKLLSAMPYALVNWASHVDLKSGRPVETGNGNYSESPKLILPGAWGAHSWQPMSYNPGTGLVYIPTLHIPMLFSMPEERFEYRPGQFNYVARHVPMTRRGELAYGAGSWPGVDIDASGIPHAARAARSSITAWDPVKQRTVWEVDTTSDRGGLVGVRAASGVMTTASGLLFQGRDTGQLVILDAKTGAQLHSINVGASVVAAPMTYLIDDQQFIALMAHSEKRSTGQITAFRLGGGPIPEEGTADEPQGVSAPPLRTTATAQQIRRGAQLFERHCSSCHASGRAPDLTKMSAHVHREFTDIVLKGVRANRGMGDFSSVLSEEETGSIHAFLTDLAWENYMRASRGTERHHPP